MSVEAAVITLLIEDGTPKKAFQHGITAGDFDMYDEEFQWIENRAANKQPINPRIFRERFPDFEWLVPNEILGDLLSELKQERAFTSLSAALETVEDGLDIENAVEKANELRDLLSEIVRAYSPIQPVNVGTDYPDHLAHMKQLRVLSDNGEVAGIPTGFKWLDEMWGGFNLGRVITVLGRTGEGKSFTLAKMQCAAWMGGYRAGVFTPEMNRHEHTCRLHTLMSADPLIQERCGLTQAFRNRALMEGRGFPWKKYAHFTKYLETLRGGVILFTQQYRRSKMTVSYIDSMIDDLGLDIVFIDPIYKLRGPKKRDSPVWELADLIDEIEDMAKGHNVPVILTNQAHRQRGVAARKTAPHKDTSYMSDAITHESDHVIGVRFDAEDKLLRLRCSKSRFGGEFDVDVEFHPNIGLFKETSQPKGGWFNGSEPNRGEPGEDLPPVSPTPVRKEQPTSR